MEGKQLRFTRPSDSSKQQNPKLTEPSLPSSYPLQPPFAYIFLRLVLIHYQKHKVIWLFILLPHGYVGMHQPVDMEGLKHTLHIHRLGAEPFPKSSSVCKHVREARTYHNWVPVGYRSSLQLDE